MIQPTLINLHPNEYSQEFHYNLSAVKLDRCVGSCNTLNDLSNKICVPTKTEDLKLSVFIFINYYSIIDSRYYLLLSDKISSKTVITISLHI